MTMEIINEINSPGTVKKQDLNTQWEALKLSITLPKNLKQAIDDISKMAELERDDFLALLTIEKLIEFHEEKTSIISYIKGLNNIIKTLSKGLSEYYKKEYKELNSLDKKKSIITKEKIDIETFEVTLKFPEKIMTCIDRLSKFTLRTKKGLLTNIFVEKLQWLERDEESLIDYIFDSKDFFRNLRTGINTYFNKNIL